MNRQDFNREWLFIPGENVMEGMRSKENIIVDLPHDFSIIQKRNPHTLSNNSNAFFPGGYAFYEKKFYAPPSWGGKKVMLEFEGVYMNSTVRLNNQIVAHHPYGYTGFHCELTPYLLFDRENTVKVTVNNSALPNTRWYSGSGIYRHVWLLVSDGVNIPPWGVFATTPKVSRDSSLVSVRTRVENGSDDKKCVVVRSALLDRDGKKAAFDEMELEVEGNSIAETEQSIEVSPANLWSVEDPYLYTLASDILIGGKVVDSAVNMIGIRSISFDVRKGFQLNGVSMKLKGGCVHHDCGLLGAAAYDRAEERKIELLKESGFNAVRCAHNPPSPAFLNACDRLGMLVIDEAFDCWREEKKINDYSNFFEEWWEKDMASMVLRDRNHPSIIMWSTGNEIAERDGRSEGYAYSLKLADFIRNLDDTRAITNALCGIGNDPLTAALAANKAGHNTEDDYWGERTFAFARPLDVVGYNYLLSRYERDGKKYPERIICGTETYPKEAYDYWEAVEKLPYVIGDFVWTALDYLGEAGIGHVWYNGEKDLLGKYPWHHAFCGDIDICGFKRPQSYYRDCVWGISEKPYIAVYKPENYGKQADISAWGWQDVVSSWTWPGFVGKPVIIEVYSRDDEVELILNNRCIGRRLTGKKNRYIAVFETKYEAGELVAVGYQNGGEKSRSVLKTASVPASISLMPDRSVLKPKFGELSYITARLLDKDGNIVHNASDTIFFTASGVGSLLAVGSGNPVSEEMYTGNRRRVHEGCAMAVLRANGELGEITLTASAEGMPAESVTIKVK